MYSFLIASINFRYPYPNTFILGKCLLKSYVLVYSGILVEFAYIIHVSGWHYVPNYVYYCCLLK